MRQQVTNSCNTINCKRVKVNFRYILLLDYAAMQYNKHMPIRIPYLCLIVGHKRDRKHAWFDGMDWRSNCVYCNIGMIRGAHSWRVFMPSDYSIHRESKDISRAEAHKSWSIPDRPSTSITETNLRSAQQQPEVDPHVRNLQTNGQPARQKFMTVTGWRMAPRRSENDRYG